MKKCTLCEQYKTEDQFYKKRDKKASHCKDCEKKMQKHRYSINKDKVKNTVKKWALANVERKSKNNKNWHIKNKELHKLKRRQYEEKNRDTLRIKKRKKYRDIYNGKMGHLPQLRRRIRLLISTTIRSHNFTKKSRTYELLGCTYEEFTTHLGPKPEGDYHLDHICPCAQAQNEEELIKLQHYTNFRWLKAEENLTKSYIKTPEAEDMCRVLLNREWIT